MIPFQSFVRQNCCFLKREYHLKSFQEIPGPPSLPVFGNTHLLMKKPHGFKKSWLNLKAMRQQYLSKDDKLMRMQWPLINKTGNVVLLLDPFDVQKVHQHEGKYPNR